MACADDAYNPFRGEGDEDTIEYSYSDSETERFDWDSDVTIEYPRPELPPDEGSSLAAMCMGEPMSVRQPSATMTTPIFDL